MMKLISCYVTGFGGLENYEYDFKEGLNVVLEENGWGKTSFCVFIKAMFYGLEYKKGSKSFTERKHYIPWDGTVCGGNLTFEKDHKRYRIERTFGQREKEDTFQLIDVSTGRISEDYSANIGEEIFEVDRDSFEKSVFAPQTGMKTSMTDSLNAKIGDLSAAKDDMNNFDAAIAKIEAKKKEYSQTSQVNPGKLVLVKKEISECREKVEALPVKMEAYDLQGKLLETKTERLQKLKVDRLGIQEKIAIQSKREQEIGAFRAKQENLKKNKEELAALDDFFANGIPEMEEIADVQEKQNSLHGIRGRLETVMEQLPSKADEGKLNELFRNYEVTEDQLDEWDGVASRMKDLRVQGEHNQMPEEEKAKLAELKYYFAKKVPTEEELLTAADQVTSLVRADAEMSVKEKRYHTLLAEKEVMDKSNKSNEKGRGVVLLLFLLGLVCIAGGVVFSLYIKDAISPILATGFSVAGVILELFAFIHMLHRRTQSTTQRQGLDGQIDDAYDELEESKLAREEIADYCKKFLEGYLVTPTENMQDMIREIQEKTLLYKQLLKEEKKYNDLNSENLEELSELQLSLYTGLSHYASVYNMDLYKDGNEIDLLHRLRHDFRTYKEYLENKKIKKELKEQRDFLEEEIGGFLGRFSPIEGEENQLNGIEHNLRTYQRLSVLVENLEKELATEKEIADFPKEEISIEQLQAMQQETEAESELLSEQLVRDNEDFNRMSEEIEICENAKERLNVLLEEEMAIQEKIDIYDASVKYLQQAKDNFLSKYMGPLRKGLRRYLSMIYDDKDSVLLAKNFSLDMDLRVHYNFLGSTKEEGFLSAGYQDLVSFCSRLALIDALYQEEKPLLILDDPFTDLDQGKITEALSLLKEISNDRQVLYFTCHESRMV
ncbi:MAG: hypothetical protein K6F30_02940 [Lachnospiraceae bacterium]|nr:hypothetical protein [Lachnospiraceae bacterium]